MEELELTLLGSFEIEDSILGFDPNESSDKGIIFEALPGNWNIYRNADEYYTHELIIIHESVKKFDDKNINWIPESNEIAVSSGQFGFCDLNKLDSNKELFTELIGNSLEYDFAINDYACITQSGQGDGYYSLYLAYNLDGEAFAAKIIFIGEEENSGDSVYFESYEEDKFSENLFDNLDNYENGDIDDYEETD